MKAIFFALAIFAMPASAESLSATLGTVLASPCPTGAAWAKEAAELNTLLFQIKQGAKVVKRKGKATDIKNIQDIWGAVANEMKHAENQITARIAKCG